MLKPPFSATRLAQQRPRWRSVRHTLAAKVELFFLFFAHLLPFFGKYF